MKKIRSYTSIWSVDRVFYAIHDFRLPFPMTFMQVTWFVVSLLLVVVWADIPPLSLIEGFFLKYLGLPVAVTLFMSQKTFDGKKPYCFLRSVLLYLCRPKVTYAGKAVRLQTQKVNAAITAVRSGIYGVPD